ncbi:MAG: methylated-DNA--[protein]-cysteine S-methyltransferase [Desulfobacteraceae bacterium]|jgi:O-6-methylguanine DNA methyltransferase
MMPISGCLTTKIYCRPDCSAGRRTKPENKIYFPSKEEARANGYRACKICKPDEEHKMPEIFFLTRYHSPLGTYVLGSSKKGVVCVKTEDRSKAYLSRWEREGIELEEGAEQNDRIISQLDAYFAGILREFTIPLDLRGTSFQGQVWKLLCGIPWGETRSYAQIAKGLGRPRAARAVGRAVGTNPVSIVVPCHRVIGSNGSLTGYGGGLDRKTALLKLEGR